MENKHTKLRLIIMNFLEFAVWGAYLTSQGRYLAGIGLGPHIGWFYSIQGIVSIFMPTLMGIIADKWITGAEDLQPLPPASRSFHDSSRLVRPHRR